MESIKKKKVKCACCNKKFLMIFKCDCCDSVFCIAHRLPETHHCVADFQKKDLLKIHLPKLETIKLDKI